MDDEYMTWNRNHYTPNNDGPAYHQNKHSLPYRCCNSAPGTVCPAGFTLTGATCMKDTHSQATYYVAQDTCRSNGAHVCSHAEMMEMCGNGANPYSGDGNGWFGDHGTTTGGNWDDEFLTWNRNHCTENNDGPAYHQTAVNLPYRCCNSAPGTVCPADFKLVGATCMKDPKKKASYYSAQDTCMASSAHICSHKEMMEMCSTEAGHDVELSGGNDGYAKNLQACIGECDSDSQCSAGLKCFQRNGVEAIPGCKGSGHRGWDFCYDPQPALGWYGDHGTTTGGNWDDEFRKITATPPNSRTLSHTACTHNRVTYQFPLLTLCWLVDPVSSKALH